MCVVRQRARHHRVGHHLALIRHAGLVAEEGPRTGVAVVEGRTIRVGGTFAIDLVAFALPGFATVVDRARVPVIAITLVELHGAAAEAIADVIGARIVVVANYGQPDALPILTVVTDGARIVVHALPLIENHMLTSFLAKAGIDGASVIIVADADGGIDRDIIRFINVAVAIVIDPVAGFLPGDGRVAVRQPLLGANPLARTGAELVDNFAGGEKAKGNRFGGAGTHSGIDQTLQDGNPIHRLRFGAGEAPGALFVSATQASAETPLIAIVEADVFRTPNTLAIIGINAGFAEKSVA